VKNTFLVTLAALTLLSMSVQAENTQQDKMKSCNAEAKTQNLAGDARKSFMKTCLSSQPAAPKLNSQQEKMKQCNADAKAKGLSGAERKSFMSTCLKG
jgi:psiF repeat